MISKKLMNKESKKDHVSQGTHQRSIDIGQIRKMG